MTPKALVDTEKVKILKLLQQTMAKLNTDQEKLDLLSEIEDVIDSYTFVPVDDISPPNTVVTKWRPKDVHGKQIHSSFEKESKKFSTATPKQDDLPTNTTESDDIISVSDDSKKRKDPEERFLDSLKGRKRYR